MPNKALNEIKNNLYSGSVALIKDYLNFPLRTVSSSSFKLADIAKDCKSEQIFETKVIDVKVVGVIPKEDCESQSNECFSIDGYNLITVIALELTTGFYPTLNWIKDYTRFINSSFHNSPVLVILSYGGKLSLSMPERRMNINYNDREVAGNVSVLRNISLGHISRHQMILFDRLKFENSNDISLKETCKNWMESFSIVDKELLISEFIDMFENDSVFVDWEELKEVVGNSGSELIRHDYDTLFDFLLTEEFSDYHQDVVMYVEHLLRSSIEDFINKFGLLPRTETVVSWFMVRDLPLIHKNDVEYFLSHNQLPVNDNKIKEESSDNPEELCCELPLEEHSDDEINNCPLSDVVALYSENLEIKVIEKIVNEKIIINKVSSFQDMTSEFIINVRGWGKGTVDLIQQMQVEMPAKANQVLSLEDIDNSIIDSDELLVSLPIAKLSVNKSLLDFICNQSRLNIPVRELTVNTLLELKLVNLLKFPSTSHKRLIELINFKKELDSYYKRKEMLSAAKDRLGPWYDKIQVTFSAIPQRIRVVVLDALGSREPLVSFFINLPESQFRGGKLKVWLGFKKKLTTALSKLTIESYLKGACTIFRPHLSEDMGLNYLDNIIIRDLNLFFENINEFVASDGLKERDKTILAKRLGFGCEKKILQTVADGFNLTRERVRQIEENLLYKLKWVLSISPSQVKTLVDEYPVSMIINKMPKLFASFLEDEKAFKDFLKKYAEVDFFGEKDICFDDFWANKFGIAIEDEIINYLQGEGEEGEFELSIKQARNFFTLMKQKGHFYGSSKKSVG